MTTMDRLRVKKGPGSCPWPFMLRRGPKRTGPATSSATAAASGANNNSNNGHPTLATVQPESLEIPIDPVGKEWTCCFGLHVHTATIMIGLWHLFLNVLALCLLAIIWRNPHMVDELDSSYDYGVDMSAPALPTPLSKVEPPFAFRDRPSNYLDLFVHSLTYLVGLSSDDLENFDMGGLVCTCMIAITLMLLYGAIKGKPSHLLPFFCLQIFDFAITTLTAAGYVCYLQAMHRLISESHRVPWREKLLELSPEELVCVVLVVFVCIVFLKAYAIGIVWRCYKYLHIRQQNMRTFLACVMPADMRTAQMLGNEEQRAYTTLLPNYDEAINQYMKQAPPPSYQAAMSNFRVPVALVHGNNEAPMENNNDASNNNNTVHFNANTPPMQHRGDLNVSAGSSATTTTTLTSNQEDSTIEPVDVEDTDLPSTSAAAAAALRHQSSSSTSDDYEQPPTYNFSVALSERDEPQEVNGIVAPNSEVARSDIHMGGALRHNHNDESRA